MKTTGLGDPHWGLGSSLVGLGSGAEGYSVPASRRNYGTVSSSAEGRFVWG